MANRKLLKKISTSLPETLLKEACLLSSLNQTEALIQGLQELVRKEKRERLISLKGKLKISLDLDRERDNCHFSLYPTCSCNDG
jgi:hypothetical protein